MVADLAVAVDLDVVEQQHPGLRKGDVQRYRAQRGAVYNGDVRQWPAATRAPDPAYRRAAAGRSSPSHRAATGPRSQRPARGQTPPDHPIPLAQACGHEPSVSPGPVPPRPQRPDRCPASAGRCTGGQADRSPGTEDRFRGSGGGSLAPLADQLNHDLTRLPVEWIEQTT
jgi:hypothetical protein